MSLLRCFSSKYADMSVQLVRVEECNGQVKDSRNLYNSRVCEIFMKTLDV
jgi:hypothetical protein